MNWPRLRSDPLRAEKGAPKRARQAIKDVIEGGPVTIRTGRLNKSWGWRKGQYVAWIEQCGEDEYGFCATSDTVHHAVMKLSRDFQRVIHVCTKYPHLQKTAYRTKGWAWEIEE